LNLGGEIFPLKHTKYIFAHHFEPGWECKALNLDRLISEFASYNEPQKKVKCILKICLFPIYYARNILLTKHDYRLSYDFADKTIVLANGYEEQYMKFAGIHDASKFKVIPNTLSFSNMPEKDVLSNKEKRVLIVSRMQERQKRIKLALKIWKKIKENKEADGWVLDIVGDGPDLHSCINYVESNKIPGVKFYGRQKPNEFYKRSSIFFMTSKSEGWPITLNEAEQFGCVPLVFNTVIAFKDIVRDTYNGFLIKDGNIQDYVEKTCLLMKDNNLRLKMAKNGYVSCQRFSREKVGSLWKDAIGEVSKNEK
jgi:glycosyltransferase involved in cell wall biosynthesis